MEGIMRFRVLLLVALCVGTPVFAAQDKGPESGQVSTDPLANLDAEVADILKNWNVPGLQIAVVKDGKVLLSKGYGTRNPATGAPMTAETLVPIASMSKAFTAFSVGLLVDEGKLDFDRPVAAYLPGFTMEDPAATSGITLRDMLSHRTGLPRHDALWYHNSTQSRDGMLAALRHLEPSAPLRAKWQYNNIMFTLSGLAVEKASGQEWEKFVERRIFAPLGMTRSTLSPDIVAADANHAVGTEVRAGKTSNLTLYRGNDLVNPAGGVYTTANDLTHWLQVQLGGGDYQGKSIIRAATLAQMHGTQMITGATPDHPEVTPTGYGLGWFTEIHRGHRIVQHGGNLPGSSTLISLAPNSKLGVTVLVNQSGSSLPRALSRMILDRLLGEKAIDWTGEALVQKKAAEASDTAGRGSKEATRVKGTSPAHAIADYAATYRNAAYGDMLVNLNSGALTLTFNDDSSALSHFHYDVFDATTEDPDSVLVDGRFQFVTDMAGRVSGISTLIEPQVAPIIFKRQPDAKLSDPAYLKGLTGTYKLSGVEQIVALSGNTLILTGKGGRPAELVPGLAGEFTHPRQGDLRIMFTLDAKGKATGVVFIDTTGVYEAVKVGD
jgi:CubicO group peptidase (beta-lactamase class C family)